MEYIQISAPELGVVGSVAVQTPANVQKFCESATKVPVAVVMVLIAGESDEGKNCIWSELLIVKTVPCAPATIGMETFGVLGTKANKVCAVDAPEAVKFIGLIKVVIK